MKIPSPRGGPHASRKRFPLSAPRTAPAGREHALLARGLPLIIIIIITIALAALVLSSVGHAQDMDPVLVSNTEQTAGSDLATATGRVTYAQSFTTGDHTDGYFLSSVEVGLKADSGVTAEVALWRTHRATSLQRIGFFFYPRRILTTLSGVATIDEDAATLERFSANDVLLLPGTTYWIVVTRTGGADDGLSVATTSSEDAVDAGGMAGFSVGNNVWVPDPDIDYGWADYSGSVDASMKIGLRGSEATRPPGPYATNRNDQSRAAAAATSSSTSRYATSFTTAGVPDTHQLTSVLLGVAAEAGVSPRVAIHADASGGRPAASALTNGTLTAPADVSRVLGAPDRAEFTASPAISLTGGTRYWVVLDVGSGTGMLSVSTTASDDNDNIPQPQWRLGDTMKAYNGTSWSNDSSPGRSFRMALNGPTDQYTASPLQHLRQVRIGLPQVGVGISPEIFDESFRVKNATWQWQRGETSDGTFTDIPAEQGGTSRVYVPAAADLGKWLKALASYENAFGPGKMLSGVSGQAVLSQPIMSNAGQISDINYILQQPDTVDIAQAFTTGVNPSGYSLSGLRFGIKIDTDLDALSWALHDDAAGEPAAEPLFTEIAVPSDSLDAEAQTFEDLVHPGFPLAPDTKYWAVLTSSPLMEETENPTLGLAGISERGDNVILDGPAAELDPGSESGWTLHFSTLSSPQDLLSTEEWVRFTKALDLEVNGKMALRMSVLTYPQVTASFGQAAYTVAEGATQSVTVTLSADPERTVTIPIVTMGQDGATDADYSGVPDSVTFNAGGPTEMTFTFTATQDTVDDEGESVLLGFGPDLSGGVSAGTPDETTLTITDDDPPEVSFGQDSYTVAEGGMVSVEVKLTSAPASAVTVPVTHTPQGATSSTDYSGVPANVMFSAGETSKAFIFTATQDTVDDDGESVLLTFGTLPATVQTGTTTESTVNITDDDDAPAGKVILALMPATINESGTGNASTVTASVPSASSAATTVTVSVNPADTTTLTGNTTLTIAAGDTNSTGVVTITAVNDDAYTGNRTVAVSGTAVNSVGITDPDDVTLTITDDDIPAGCESGDILCVTVEYTDRFPSDAAGTKPLHWYHRDHDDQDMLEFVHNDFRYKVYTSSLGANPGGGTYVMPPFHIPERSSSLLGLGNLSATDPMGYWEMPNQDYLDWTLYISTDQDGATLEAKLPFNEAKSCCGHKWRWYGLDLYKLNEAWAAGKEYKLRIVEDPRADRTPEALGPPLYLEAPGVQLRSVLLRWVRPQVRNDGAPPGVSYKVQWKTDAGMWDTPPVSQHVYVPPPGEEVLSWRIRGLTPGSVYDVRVIAFNEAGDSAPSNVLRVNTNEPLPTSQNQAANSPATGGPGITGSLLAGETLTATTDGIEDEDGLTGAVFAYQWIRSDTDIEGAISSTYTMTGDDEGKAIKVRVTFSDDAGNEEALTSYARLSAPPLPPAQRDDDGPAVVVSFGSAAHSVIEGSTVDVEVEVALDVDPERTVTVPVTVRDQDGASPADYSGVPASVTFDSGEISKTFTFSAAHSVTEGGTVEVEVTLDVDPERTVTVPLTVTDQDGASPADYSGVPSSVTFDSGETSKTFTFSATQDDVDDDGESVKLAFGTPPPRVSAGTVNEFTVNIQDDDDPAVAVSFGSAAHSVTEGGTVEVEVTLDVDPERTVTVPLTVTDQDGASPADYSGVPSSVTFDSGEISKTFTFSATQDDVDDDGESVKLAFGTPPPRVSAGTVNEFTVNIQDDDGPDVVVSFGSAAHSVTEGGTVEVTVALDVDPERTVTVPLTVTDQDGASPADYSGVPASVTFDSGETSKTFTFSATQDDVDDDGESVKLAFGTPLPPSVGAGTVNESTVNIQDDGPAVVVSFGSVVHSVTEGGTVEVTVTLDVDPERTVTVPLTVTDQDGASPADYSGVPSSVTFDSGEVLKTFTFSATQDDVDDDGESVKLAFGTPLPPSVGAGTVNESTVNIQDDGPAVVVSFGSSAYSVTEGGTVEVTVTLDVDPERTVTVPLTVTDQDGASPADYSGVPSSVTFDSGEVLKTFTFSATQDDVDDDGESVKLAFGTPPPRVSVGTGNESTVNIQSKPPLTASVESAPPSHNGSDEFRIRIALSEEPKTGFSYATMRDHAFTVTGGSVTGARRLEPPSNTDWEVVVKPDSNGDVTVVLPITTDCDAQGAICTGDGRPLSNRLTITVLGPSG